MRNLLACLLLLSTAPVVVAHAHAHGHAHDHTHDYADARRHLRGADGADGHDHAEHKCIHDNIVDQLKDVQAEFREKQEAAWAAKAAAAETPAAAARRDLGARRVLSSYHPLRVKFDFSRLGYDEDDGVKKTLASGADRHQGLDMTCYEGGPSEVGETFDLSKKKSCDAFHTLTAEKRSFLKYTLAPNAKSILENALTVSDDPNNAGQNPTLPLKPWEVPCFGRSSALNKQAGQCLVGQCNCDPVDDGERDVPDADFVLYITARPTEEGVVAWATSLVRNQQNRPIAGMANFNPRYLTQPKCSDLTNCMEDADCGASTTGICTGNFKKDLGTAVHEIVHALGFSSSSWGQFKDYTYNQVIEKDSVTGVSKIITPNVVAKIREQFGCAENIGGEIEEYGGGGTAGSHWDKRIIANEFMNPTVVQNPIIFSAISMALFEDMGWYKPDYSKATHLPWGFKQGCNFIKQECKIGWSNNYFCDKAYASPGRRLEGCASFDFRGRGYCDVSTYTAALPSQYQHLSNPAQGGSDTHMNFCPIFKPYSNTPCNQGYLRNSNLRGIYGEHRSMLNENGFCFTGDYQFGTSKSSSAHQACHDIVCEADLKSYAVNVYHPGNRQKFTITCPTLGGSVPMPSDSGFTGSIQCYPANVICTVPTDCPKWNPSKDRAWERVDGPEAGVTCAGHGTCQSDLKCGCEFGYNGTYCEQRLCPNGEGGLECSGPDHGSCNRILGQCQCGKKLADGITDNDGVSGLYDGVSCDRLKCPDTGGLVCNGNGACNANGACECTGDYSGVSCELAPGCPQKTSNLFGCSNHGTCSVSTGACSCAQMNRTLQVGTRCPGSGAKGKVALNASDQDGTDPENADASECRFWSGDDCSQGSATSLTIADQVIQVNETGAWVSGSFKNTSEYIFETAEQTYTYFSFNVNDPNKDVAFVVDIQDGTDVSIFASFDNPVPTAVVTGDVYQWNFEKPNDVNNTKELLQLCGSFSYKKKCQCDDSSGQGCPECSTSADCTQKNSVCVPQGRPGVSGLMECDKQDPNARPGTMRVGVLARSHPTETQSRYKVSLLYSKCTGEDGKDDGGGCYHGTCERSTGFCTCDTYSSFNDPELDAAMRAQPAWSGGDCSSALCLAPKDGIGAGIPCAGNGNCEVIGGQPRCVCDTGWQKNSTMCNKPAAGRTLPISVPPAKIFSAKGFSLTSTGAPGAAVSGAPKKLGLGQFQTFYFDVPLENSAVSINVSAHMSDHSREFHPNRGRPDFLVAATQARFAYPTFENLNSKDIDYESWSARQMNSHLKLIRTKTNASKWFVTVLSTAYARADLVYSIHIQGTSPSQDSEGCSGLSWAYRTCGGGRGKCSVGAVVGNADAVCSCFKDTNKGEFRYDGPTCGSTIWPIPKQSATATEEEKKLPSPANLTSGKDFGEVDAGPLEPGEWTYFELDTRKIYGSLTISMTVLNSNDEITSGVIAPLLLVKSSDGGTKLPSLDADPSTLYDISGAYSGAQSITIEGGNNGGNIAKGYYVGVYNQLHSRSALQFSLRVVSTTVESTVSS